MRALVLLAAILILCSPAPAPAQGTASIGSGSGIGSGPAGPVLSTEKLTLIANAALAGAEGLRLPENRSYVFARVGALRCKDDPRSSDDLFQRAVAELVSARTELEQEKDRPELLSSLVAVRYTILSLIAPCNADLALRSLERTRIVDPRMVAAASDGNKIGASTDINAYNSSAESNFEQHLIAMAADQYPTRDVKFLQDAIRKELTGQTLSLLRKVYAKDPELARSLTTETLDRLMSTRFSQNEQGPLDLAVVILQDSQRAKKPGVSELTIDEAALRPLANKVFTYLLSIEPRLASGRVSSLMALAAKYAPGSVPALKKVEASRYPPGYTGTVLTSDTQRLLQSRDTTPSQLISEASRLPLNARAPLVQQAANKMAEADNFSGAVELLNANFTGRALDNAIESLKWWYSGLLMNKKNWADAEAVIDGMTTSNQRSAYITLATKAFQADPEKNRDFTAAVLGKARSSLPDRPTDQTELVQFIQLAGAYAATSPTDGLKLMEDIVPTLNDLTDAFNMVQTFQRSPEVRAGEFRIINNTYGIRLDTNVLRKLASSDTERMVRCINMMSRRDVRIGMLLGLTDTGPM